jgi:hypothetical protein
MNTLCNAKPKSAIAHLANLASRSSQHAAKRGTCSTFCFVRTGRHNFQSVDEIADLRIKPWLPKQATEISLFSETAGHFARYKVAKKDFEEFMDKLWR